MLSENLTRYLNHLAAEIGPRPIGSPGNLAATEYIGRELKATGLAVEEQDYACTAWEHRATRVIVNDEAIEATANAFSPACDITAPVIAIGTITELEAAPLAGQIGLLYGDLAKAPLSPKSWFLKTERDHHIIQLLESKKPAALLTVQAATAELGQVLEDWEFHIASATMSQAEALKLLKQPAAVAHLQIDSRTAPGRAANLVGRKAGERPEKIVICAHFDAKINTPGALDNGGGAAVLLALAQLLGRRAFTYGLEFVAFNGEEYLPIGDDEYVRRGGEPMFGQIIAAINIDGAGSYLGANSLAAFSCAPAFQDHLTALSQNYPGVVWVEPWPESNHSTFAFRGVPSLAFSSVGTRNIAHSPADTVDGISSAKLAEVAELIAEIVESLQDKAPAWSRASA